MKRIKQYKGFIIKENTKQAEGEYRFYIFKGMEIYWECDNLEEAIEWIECY